MPSKSNYSAFLALFCIILIDTMGFGIVFPVLSPIFMGTNGGILPLGASVVERDVLYGLTLGIFSVCMFIGAPVLGDLSDRLGRKKVLMLCLLGTSASSLICGLGIQYGSVGLLLFGRAFSGFLAGSQPIAQAAIADISDGDQKTKNLGLIAFASSVGFVIGPIVGGFFSTPDYIPWFNYSTPFMFDAILAGLNALLLSITFKETYAVKPGKIYLNLAKGLNIFVDAFKHKEVRILSLAFLLTETAISLYFQFVNLYLVAIYQYSPSQLGFFMSYVGFVFGVALTLVIRTLLKFFSENKIVLYGLYVSASGYLLPLVAHHTLLMWLSVLPIICGNGVAYNALLAIFSNAVSKEKQGWVMGITSSIIAASWIIGAIFTSLLFYFAPDLPYVAAAIMSTAGALFMKIYFVKRKKVK